MKTKFKVVDQFLHSIVLIKGKVRFILMLNRVSFKLRLSLPFFSSFKLTIFQSKPHRTGMNAYSMLFDFDRIIALTFVTYLNK